MRMTETEEVIIARRCGTHTSIYHTDEDCRQIDRSERPQVRRVDLNTLHDGWSECTYCAEGEPATRTAGSSHSYDHLNALRAAAEEDA